MIAPAERWGMTLSLISRSWREHVDYWRLVSWGFVPEEYY
jgi:hypothetical protein